MTTPLLQRAEWVTAVRRHWPNRDHGQLGALLAERTEQASLDTPLCVDLDPATVRRLCEQLHVRAERLAALLRSLLACGYLAQIQPPHGPHRGQYRLTVPTTEHPQPAESPRPAMPAALDTSIPHSARRYNYWLGGKDNFAADRASGDAIAAAFPHIRTAAIENRRFLERAVTYLATEHGIRQFIDIGTGIPIAPYVHDIAARSRPDTRVVYVDNDPLVLAHARALMTATPPAVTAYIDADLRRPETILASPDLYEVIDLDEPVGLLLVAVLHFLTDADHPADVIGQLAEPLPTGSHVVLSHATFDPLPPDVRDRLADLTVPDAGHGPFHPRTQRQVCDLITGLDQTGPGLVPITDWEPDLPPHPTATFGESPFYGAVARKQDRID